MARSRSSRRAAAKGRKRKLDEAAPGAIVILKRKRTAGKTQQFRGKGLLHAAIKVEKGLDFDGDIRKLAQYVRDDLADHIRDSLLAGKRADGSGALPDLSPRTKNRPESRVGGFGLRTGTRLAAGIYRGRIRGGPSAAKATITPSRDPAVMRLVSLWLARPHPVDLLSIDGVAHKVIVDAIKRWQADAVGDGVYTPTVPATDGGPVGKL